MNIYKVNIIDVFKFRWKKKKLNLCLIVIYYVFKINYGN